MFGYLNLGNSKQIAATESQECANCRVDRGFLEYAQWPVETHPAWGVSLGSLFANGRVYRSLPYPDETGAILWDYASVTGDKLGIAKPVAVPTVAAVAHGSQPYPPGTYQWAMTLYNPASGEESIPELTADIAIGVNEVAEFSSIPSYAATYPKKTGLIWRIYRRPVGSGEYLLALELPAYAAAITDVDDTTDDNLGEACDSFDNNVLAFGTSIALFGGRLFLVDPSNNTLRFSKTDQPWAFPATFQFAFGEGISGIYGFDERLVITLRSKRGKILYGDDETNYVMKDMDADIGIAQNGGRIIAGVLPLPQQSFQIAYTEPPTDSNYLIDGITIFDGLRPVNVSNKIRSLFPRFGFYENSTDDTWEPKTGVVENRFFVMQVNDTRWPISSLSEIQTTHSKIVMDIANKGFMTGDDTATFRYRTKDFSMPPRLNKLRRIMVESEGQVRVEVYLDGELASTIDLNNATRKDEWLYVKPWSCDSFSLRFIGQPGAKVYSFAVVDPAVKLGGE